MCGGRERGGRGRERGGRGRERRGGGREQNRLRREASLVVTMFGLRKERRARLPSHSLSLSLSLPLPLPLPLSFIHCLCFSLTQTFLLTHQHILRPLSIALSLSIFALSFPPHSLPLSVSRSLPQLLGQRDRKRGHGTVDGRVCSSLSPFLLSFTLLLLSLSLPLKRYGGRNV